MDSSAAWAPCPSPRQRRFSCSERWAGGCSAIAEKREEMSWQPAATSTLRWRPGCTLRRKGAAGAEAFLEYITCCCGTISRPRHRANRSLFFQEFQDFGSQNLVGFIATSVL